MLNDIVFIILATLLVIFFGFMAFAKREKISIMDTQTADLMNRGMICLTKHMGPLDSQLFISAVLREKVDFEQWRHLYNIKDETAFEKGVQEGKREATVSK